MFYLDLRLYLVSTFDGITLGKTRRISKAYRTDIDANDWLWKNAYHQEHPGFQSKWKPLHFTWKAYYVRQDTICRNLALGRLGKFIELERQTRYEPLFVGNKIFYRDSLLYYDLKTGKSEELDLTLCSLPTKSTKSHLFLTGKTQISIWDCIENKLVFAINIPEYSIYHFDDNCVIFTNSDGKLEIWDYKSNRIRTTFQIPSINIQSGFRTLLQDNIFIVLDNLEEPDNLLAFDINKGVKLYEFQSPYISTFCAFSDYLYITTDDGTEIIEINSGNPHLSFEHVYQIKHCYPNFLVIPSEDRKQLNFWNLDTRIIEKSFVIKDGKIQNFYPTTKYIFITTESTLTIYNSETLASIHKSTYDSIEDGHITEYFIIFRENKKFHFWDLHTAKPLGTLDCLEGARFRGEFLYYANASSIVVHNLNTLPEKNSSLLNRLFSIFTRCFR